MSVLSDMRTKLMAQMDVIEEQLGKERLLDEIIMGMSTDELKDNVEWISNNWDIRFDEETDPAEEHDWYYEDEDEIKAVHKEMVV